jgi:hypothetical protein
MENGYFYSSLGENLQFIIDYFYLISVKWPGCRPRNDIPSLVKYPHVTWTEELRLISDPSHTTPEVSTDVGHRDKVATVYT